MTEKPKIVFSFYSKQNLVKFHKNGAAQCLLVRSTDVNPRPRKLSLRRLDNCIRLFGLLNIFKK